MKFKKIITILGTLAVAIGLTGFLAKAISKVSKGEGLEYYFTGHGVKINYIGVLVVIILIPIILAVGYIYRRIYKMKELHQKSNLTTNRKFKRKYKVP